MLEGYIKQLRSWILMPNAEIRTPALSFTSSVTWVVYLTSLNCRSVTYERTTVISTHKVVVRIKASTHTCTHTTLMLSHVPQYLGANSQILSFYCIQQSLASFSNDFLCLSFITQTTKTLSSNISSKYLDKGFSK